jgi:hypothetical protein
VIKYEDLGSKSLALGLTLLGGSSALNVGFVWLHEAINPKSRIKKYVPYLFSVGMGLSTVATNAMAL